MLSYVQTQNLLTAAHKEFANINFRYTIVPTTIFPNENDPLRFKSENVKLMIEMGKQDALSIIEKGSGIAHAQIIAGMLVWLKHNQNKILKAQLNVARTIEDTQKELKKQTELLYKQRVSNLEF